MSSKTPAAVSSATHPSVGTFIDGDSLELVEVLGVGGYGVVYRALDVRSPSRRSYAVKCLVSSPNQTPRQRQVHIREIALHQLASVHPNVVTLHRVVEENHRTYIVMDYAPDHDLFTQILHSCRYLGDDALIKHVFLQLLDAVEYCHRLGIYHRDLKPENILCFDDGLRVAITDFGLATSDKLSEEFRTGSVYHMSPECQGGEFAPTGNYSPMFNDIWSLGIILLNLATGRNPWKSATPDDHTFQAYLRDPQGFLPTVLPISAELNDVLVRMLEVDWRQRMTLQELRHAIEDVHTFYSDGVIFEGSMARCPWESGMDIDSDSSSDTKEDSSYPTKSDALVSRWSKDSSSDIIFANNSCGDDSSYGAAWTNYSSQGTTWDIESLSSLASRGDAPTAHHHNRFDRTLTPVSPSSTGSSSLPVTPNSLDTIFCAKARLPPPKVLTIDTDFAAPLYYHANASMDSSYSTRTSMMQTAVEYDPYSSSFFLATAPSHSKDSLPFQVSHASPTSFDDKMTSPSIWTSSPTQISSPSIYSSTSSIETSAMSFARSTTPSPEAVWSEYHRMQVQCHPQYETSQRSPSFYAMMTDLLSPPRPTTVLANPAKKSSHDSGKSKAVCIFNPIKFFPRSPPPTSPPASSNGPSHGRHASEPSSSHLGDQAPAAACVAPAWAGAPPLEGHQSPPPATIQLPVQDRRVSHLRSPRHWFIPGKFFASVGAQ